jgi:V8-like Glu-specific endopeptidase
MASILDASKYPFHESEAQQLHTILTQINATSAMAVLAAEKAGVDTMMIFRDQAPALIWADILRAAASQGLTRALVKQTAERLNASSPFITFLQKLLANQPAPAEDEPRGIDGAPNFLSDSDEISEPEALLYQDDLMIQIGQVPALIGTLQTLVALAPTVCKLSVDFNGPQKRGTAFRIGSDLLLTNWHVLHRTDSGTRANAVTAEFGYEDNGAGGVVTATAIPCDAGSIVTNKDDDWAVVKTSGPLLDSWPIVKLSESVAPTTGGSAYIIQHPAGERKRLGFVRNQVSGFNDRTVHYLTDTKEGSSGSPVFDAQGKLIALHHSGGRPQEVVGKPPMKKNEGIRISKILEGANKQNLVLP